MVAFRQPRRRRSSLADDLQLHESPVNTTMSKHVVIVMDGLKDFTIEALEWALQNVMSTGYVVTLLGVMPWLNIPLSTKTWQDIWMLDFEDFSLLIKERNEWKNDPKYLKLHAVLDLCNKYGVVVKKEVVMGYPTRLLILEKIISLHASWVVFDRYHRTRKNREFFARRIACNMVMMNEEGEVDMIRGRPMIDNDEDTPSESPASLAPTPQLMISEDYLKEILKEH